MQSANSQRFYYPELDGLRFIAFLLVFIHNANPILKGTFLEKFSAYSWFGVDLFFCLSAFLITKLLIAEQQQTGKINIRNFYIRRILRIWPLYFFYIIVGTIIIAPMEGRNINIPGHLISLATFTFNFTHLVMHFSPISIFVPLWSISQEEQFYIVIPWFLQKVAILQEKTKWTVLAMLFLAGNLIRMAFIYFQFPSQWLYFLPFTHIDAMLGGLAVGLVLFDKPFSKYQRVTLFIGIFLISSVFLFPNIDVLGWGLMLTYPLIGFGMSLILFSITCSVDTPFKVLLTNRLLVYLGKISYGLYVFHVGSFTLATLLLSKFLNVPQLQYPKNTFLVLISGILLTILFSITSYNALEKPFLKLKERFRLISSHPI
jgi:peptidoglycan/LPS O-acetylase OafA/YrhL